MKTSAFRSKTFESFTFRSVFAMFSLFLSFSLLAHSKERSLRFAILGSSADYHDWDNFIASDLNPILAKRGFRDIVIEGYDDSAEFVKRGRKGSFDIIRCGSVAFIEIVRSFPMTPILKTAYKISPAKPTEYHSILVTLDKTLKQTIPDATKVGLVSPYSASGGVFPRLLLLSMIAPGTRLIFSFHSSHLKTLEALLAGEVDIVGIGDYVIDPEYLKSRESKGEFRLPRYYILGRSDPIPSDPIALSDELYPDIPLRRAIIDAFRIFRNASGADKYSWLEPALKEDYLPVVEAIDELNGRNTTTRTLRSIAQTLSAFLNHSLIQLVALPLLLAFIGLIVWRKITR